MRDISVTSRLKEFIRVAFDGKVATIADAIGWKRTALYKYMRGEQEPGKVLLEKLAEVGCNLNWLQTGQGGMFADNEAGRALRQRVTGRTFEPIANPEASNHDVGQLRAGDVVSRRPDDGKERPMFLTPVAAGSPTPVDDHVEMRLDLNKFLLPNPSSTYFVTVSGDSMLDEGIRHGDMLIIDRGAEAKAGNIVIASLNGEPTVKRLEIEGKNVVLYPANAAYKPIVVSSDMQLEILGIVTAVIHKF